jgi:hypothetical protein
VPAEYRRHRLEDEHFEDRYYRLPWIDHHVLLQRTSPRMAIGTSAWMLTRFELCRCARLCECKVFLTIFRFAGHRTNMFQQIGNAVPPLLAYSIAVRLREAIDRRSSRGWTPAALVAALAVTNDSSSSANRSRSAVRWCTYCSGESPQAPKYCCMSIGSRARARQCSAAAPV